VEFEHEADQMKRDWQAQLLFLIAENQKPLILDLLSGLYITRWKVPVNFEKFGYANLDAALTELEAIGYIEIFMDKQFRKASLTDKGKKELEYATPGIFAPTIDTDETLSSTTSTTITTESTTLVPDISDPPPQDQQQQQEQQGQQEQQQEPQESDSIQSSSSELTRTEPFLEYDESAKNPPLDVDSSETQMIADPKGNVQ